MNYENYIHQMTQLLKLKGCTEGTIKMYSQCIKKVLTALDKPVEDITTDDLMGYLHQMITLKCANSTINQNHSILNFFFSKVLRNPRIVDPIPYMRKVKKLPAILTPKEVSSIFNSSRNLKYKTIFMTIYASGLRIGEVLRLKVSDIDSIKMQLYINQGKRKKDRYAILSKHNLDCLRDYYRAYKPEDFLFSGQFNKSKPLSENTVEKEFKSTLAAAGITKKVTPHSLRHAFASHLLENGTDIYTIKSLLGHSTLRSTEVYLQLSPSRVFSTKSPLDQETVYE